MPFDKSRHLCLQAFPTSILVNGMSLLAPAPALLLPSFLPSFLSSFPPSFPALRPAHTRSLPSAPGSVTPTDTTRSAEKTDHREEIEPLANTCCTPHTPRPHHSFFSLRCLSLTHTLSLSLSFFLSATVKGCRHAAEEPPVEFTHRRCGPALCPRC